MAYIPDVCFHDAKNELVSDRGTIKHAAFYLYGYYCRRRNKDTGLCTARLERTHQDTGLPLSNVSQLKSFLDEVGWIHVYSTGIVRPLKGFYPDDEIFFTRLRKIVLHPTTVLIIRILFLKNRNLFLIIRNLFKGNINQHFKPALLTREGAKIENRDFPPHAQGKNFQKIAPAGKPTNAAPANMPAPRSSAKQTPAEDRKFHPSVQMVKEITGRFPPKDQWDRIIREIGNEPKTEFFRRSFERWRGLGGNPQNYEKWLFEPHRTGKIPEIYGAKNGNGSNSPPPADVPKNESPNGAIEPLDRAKLEDNLEMLRDIVALGGSVETWEKSYTPDDWVWLMKNLCETN